MDNAEANRLFVTEAVATIDREFKAAGDKISQDTLIVWYRKLKGLRPLAEANALPTTKIDQLIEDLNRKSFRDLSIEEAERIEPPKPSPAPPPQPAQGGHSTGPARGRTRPRAAPTGPAKQAKQPAPTAPTPAPTTPAPEPEPAVPHKPFEDRKKSVHDLFGEIL